MKGFAIIFAVFIAVLGITAIHQYFLVSIKFIEPSVALKLKREVFFDISRRQVLDQLVYSLIGLLLVVKVGRDDD